MSRAGSFFNPFESITINSNGCAIDIPVGEVQYVAMMGRKHETINFNAKVELVPDFTDQELPTFEQMLGKILTEGEALRISLEGRIKFKKKKDEYTLPSISYEYPDVDVIRNSDKPVATMRVEQVKSGDRITGQMIHIDVDEDYQFKLRRCRGLFLSAIHVDIKPHTDLLRQCGISSQILKSLRPGDTHFSPNEHLQKFNEERAATLGITGVTFLTRRITGRPYASNRNEVMDHDIIVRELKARQGRAK